MSFKDNLKKNKKGGYSLRSKVDKKEEGVCLYCGQDKVTQDLFRRSSIPSHWVGKVLFYYQNFRIRKGHRSNL